MIPKPLHFLAAAALLALASSAGAEPVTPLDTYSVGNDASFSVAKGTHDHGMDDRSNRQAHSANHFYELVVDAFDTLTTFALGSASDETVPVRYFLWEDGDTGVGTGLRLMQTVGAPKHGVAQGALYAAAPDLTARQSFHYSLQGDQYVLQVQKKQTSRKAATAEVSAVPLPGALWMFGAGLLGFVGFSSRRKL